uniref:F-box domain-containing protein n=1 Tax=Ciona savignyi TaxID=51511 RepID=H2ZE72_CIOSA
MEEDSEPQNLTPEPPRQPQVLTGRNLKRVPSERFQKMRRKVQKLMVIEHPVESDDRDTSYRPQEQDEASFLRSLRIPALSHIQKDSSQQPCDILRLPDHIITQIFSHLDTKSLAAAKCCCTDFKFIIYTFDIRGSDSKWRTDERYIDDPCKQCRHQFERGDTTMCSYHPKRYYSDIPYGRSYWMCCFQYHRSAPGCKFGLHDNDWST